MATDKTGVREFLRTQRSAWALWLLFSLLFQGIAALASVPAVFMGYAALLTLFLLLLWQAVAYRSWRKRNAQLMALHPDDPAALGEFLARYSDDPAVAALVRFAGLYRQAAADRESSEREREEYFSLWLHQVKTPLAAMSLLLERDDLSRTDLSRERQRTEQYIQLALAYLKLERPGTDLDIRPLTLDDLLRRVIARYKTLFIGSRTALEYIPLNQRVLSDAAWLELVIEQLISNALKYAPGGTIRLELAPVATLIIADDGPGIPPEELPRLFQRGFAGQVGRERGGTSGLGLYLCHRICQRLGHTLRLESTPGQGTRALLELGEKEVVDG